METDIYRNCFSLSFAEFYSDITERIKAQINRLLGYMLRMCVSDGDQFSTAKCANAHGAVFVANALLPMCRTGCIYKDKCSR